MTVNTTIVNSFVNKINSLIGGKADADEFITVRVIVTYTDNSTDTVDLYCVPPNNP